MCFPYKCGQKKSRFIILILPGEKIVAVASLNQPVPVPLHIAGLAKKLNGIKSYAREEVELLKCCAKEKGELNIPIYGPKDDSKYLRGKKSVATKNITLADSSVIQTSGIWSAQHIIVAS